MLMCEIDFYHPDLRYDGHWGRCISDVFFSCAVYVGDEGKA